MDNPDPLLIAGISAGAALAGGLIGGWLGYKGVVKQMDEQRQLTVAEHRRDSYVNYLAHSQHLFRILGGVFDMGDDTWRKFFAEFEERQYAVLLVGSDAAHAAAENVEVTLQAYLADVEPGGGKASRMAAAKLHEEAYQAALTRATEVMREDLRLA